MKIYAIGNHYQLTRPAVQKSALCDRNDRRTVFDSQMIDSNADLSRILVLSVEPSTRSTSAIRELAHAGIASGQANTRHTSIRSLLDEIGELSAITKLRSIVSLIPGRIDLRLVMRDEQWDLQCFDLREQTAGAKGIEVWGELPAIQFFPAVPGSLVPGRPFEVIAEERHSYQVRCHSADASGRRFSDA